MRQSDKSIVAERKLVGLVILSSYLKKKLIIFLIFLFVFFFLIILMCDHFHVYFPLHN